MISMSPTSSTEARRNRKSWSEGHRSIVARGRGNFSSRRKSWTGKFPIQVHASHASLDCQWETKFSLQTPQASAEPRSSTYSGGIEVAGSEDLYQPIFASEGVRPRQGVTEKQLQSSVAKKLDA